MRSMPALMPCLLALSAAFSVSACSTPAPVRQTFPLAADLAVPPKPRPTVETLTSAQASAQYNSDVEAWGDAMAAQIGRLCRWAKGSGAPVLSCPKT